MQIAEFVCPLPPSVNSYLGKRVIYNPITKKPIVQVYETSDAKAFKRHMKKVLERMREEFSWQKTGEFVYVVCEVDVYLNQKRRDTDNLFKCLLDTLTENGIVYDDSMVIPRVQKVFVDSKNPRIEVRLREHPKKGVFASYNHLREFERNHCEKCSRFSRNCSIRKDSLENKIRSEIERVDSITYTCNAIKTKKECKS